MCLLLVSEQSRKMRFIICTLFVLYSEILQTYVFCRSVKIEDSDENEFDPKDLWKVFGSISRTKEIPQFNRRNVVMNQADLFSAALSNSVDMDKLTKWLRVEAEGNHEEAHAGEMQKDEMAALVEKELLHALSKKASALLSKPFVQKKGRNDFLVMQSDIRDPFVTVIPNDIYYNVEKKCINWLDDCNQKGIRDRLLHKVNSPY